MTVPPDKQAESGRDPETGQFLPGHSGNPAGRPRALDFRKLVNEQIGESMATRLMAVFHKLEDLALEGDVQAIKLLLDRVTDADPKKVELDVKDERKNPGPPEPETADLVAGIKKLGQLAQEHFGDGEDGGQTAG